MHVFRAPAAGLVLAAGLAAFCLAPRPAPAQWDEVEIGSQELTSSIHVLTGRGGNMAVCVGDDGIFLVDDQYAPLTEKIRAKIAAIHDGPVRFVLNTHWHADHTGGNENFGETGSLIVAHDNVRARMAIENVSTIWDRTTPPSPEGALPVVTFDDEVTFHVNGETVRCFHVANAHTDGDTIVQFVDADVIHMGDVFFNGLYPFIDTDSGGSIDGMIAAVERVLALCTPDTRLIAGHGPVGDLDSLRSYHDMLVRIRARMNALIRDGADLDTVIAAAPTAEWDAEWGRTWIGGEKFTEIVFGDLAGRAPAAE